MQSKLIFSDPRYLLLRSCFIESIRDYFSSHCYIEVHSPIFCSHPIPERHIEIYDVNDGAHTYYLTPSPEVYLKQILAKLSLADTHTDYKGLYEITHSFRKMEQQSPIHQKEFLMLEYYHLASSTEQMQNFTIAMLKNCIQALLIKNETLKLLDIQIQHWMKSLQDKIHSMSITEAFSQYTSINFEAFLNCSDITECYKYAGLNVKDCKMDWEDIFHYMLVQHLEPVIPKDAILFLYDYPANVKTLAKRKDDTKYSDRWELYIAGVEVANCFNEEINPEHIFSFMQEQANFEGARTVSHQWDTNYLRDPPLPQCSGVAMGIDRLYMTILGYTSLEQATTLHELLY